MASMAAAVSPEATGVDASQPLSELPPPGGWGSTLKVRRKRAGLSQPELARRAGLSEGTIRRMESGSHTPSRETLIHLAAVPELCLSLDNPAMSEALGESDGGGVGLNCYIAAGFNAIDNWQEMMRELNGEGGHVDQTHLYLDHVSSATWYALSTHESYAPARRAMPLERAALAVLESVGEAGLDVIALGSGDGKDEVRLVQHLFADSKERSLRLFLLDISQPLLSAAFEHASERLADLKWVQVTAVQGNFHHLSRYRPLLYQPERAHRRRVVCMLGYTFSNLLNEPLFIRNSLAGFGPGDLMLLDVPLTCAPADRPDEIRKKDPRLSGRLPANLPRFQGDAPWLKGPIERCVKDVQDVTLETVLDVAACPVPGSYAAVTRARVTLARGQTRVFSLLYSKRYDEEKLVECFRQEGWDPVEGWHYGTYHPSLLYLFRKR